MSLWIRVKVGEETVLGTLEGNTVAVHAGALFDHPEPTGETISLDDAEILTPVVPSKIVALANNSRAMLAKQGKSHPEEPHYLLKANSSLHPHGRPIRRPAGYDGKIVFEGELGLVIGAQCRNVPVETARGHIFGCTCVNDVTSIDLLNKDPAFAQWVWSKAADTYGVIGPVVATGLNLDELVIRSELDGSERQNYSVADLVFGPDRLVAEISKDMTLLAGDVIACGTSLGVGQLRPGNTIAITIDGVGTLENTFA